MFTLHTFSPLNTFLVSLRVILFFPFLHHQCHWCQWPQYCQRCLCQLCLLIYSSHILSLGYLWFNPGLLHCFNVRSVRFALLLSRWFTLPVCIYKMDKKQWKQTFSVTFFVPSSSSILFCIVAIVVDTRPLPFLVQWIRLENLFSGSCEITFNIFEIFGRTFLLSLPAGGFIGFLYTVNKCQFELIYLDDLYSLL